MTCNGSGWSSPELGAQFGIVSYDWSNAKTQWAAAKPMDCEKRLQTQARMTIQIARKHDRTANLPHVHGHRDAQLDALRQQDGDGDVVSGALHRVHEQAVTYAQHVVPGEDQDLAWQRQRGLPHGTVPPRLAALSTEC